MSLVVDQSNPSLTPLCLNLLGHLILFSLCSVFNAPPDERDPPPPHHMRSQTISHYLDFLLRRRGLSSPSEPMSSLALVLFHQCNRRMICSSWRDTPWFVFAPALRLSPDPPSHPLHCGAGAAALQMKLSSSLAAVSEDEWKMGGGEKEFQLISCWCYLNHTRGGPQPSVSSGPGSSSSLHCSSLV